MEELKKQFVEFLIRYNAFKVGDFVLKSGKHSSYFVNMGVFNDGESLWKLGTYFARFITEKFAEREYDLILGPSYKGIPLASTIVSALWKEHSITKQFFYDRKEEKKHGDEAASGMTRLSLRIPDHAKIIIIDDVFTTGLTKIELMKLIKRICTTSEFVGCVVAVDRREGDDHQELGIPLHAIVTLPEILTYYQAIKKL